MRPPDRVHSKYVWEFQLCSIVDCHSLNRLQQWMGNILCGMAFEKKELRLGLSEYFPDFRANTNSKCLPRKRGPRSEADGLVHFFDGFALSILQLARTGLILITLVILGCFSDLWACLTRSYFIAFARIISTEMTHRPMWVLAFALLMAPFMVRPLSLPLLSVHTLTTLGN